MLVLRKSFQATECGLKSGDDALGIFIINRHNQCCALTQRYAHISTGEEARGVAADQPRDETHHRHPERNRQAGEADGEKSHLRDAQDSPAIPLQDL